LPLLLQCSLADAIDSLRLPEAAVQALRARSGPWAGSLELVETLERQDMVELEKVAQPFGGVEPVLAGWAQAWLS
ncbi:MAG: hypothetical protein KGI35_20655, partial [Burkholderiales bacterium]|nr:hypothetical protein [Burkholderiales bacterium]